MITSFFLHSSFPTVFESLLFIYLSYLLGRLFLRAFLREPLSSVYEGPYAILLGYGLFGMIALALGMYGRFSRELLLVVTVLIVLLSRKVITENGLVLRGSIRSAPRAALAFWRSLAHSATSWLSVVIGIWLFSYILIALVPITAHDTLFYHYPIIESVTHEKAIIFDSTAKHYGYLPILGELIYAVPTLFFNETTAPFVFQMVQVSLLFIFLAIVWAFMKERVRTDLFVPGTVLMLLSMMEMEREVFHFGYIDYLAFVFGLAAFFLTVSLYRTARGMRLGEACTVGTLLGFAVGVKYTGLYFVLLTGVALFFDSARKRKWGNFIRTGSVIVLTLLVVGGFWYLKNVRGFGNPVYPLYSFSEYNSGIGLFIVKPTFANLLRFPWIRWGGSYLAHPERESSTQLLHFLYFVLFLFTLLGSVLRKRFRQICPEAFAFSFFTLGYLTLLFFGSHQARFLVPLWMTLPPAVFLFGDEWFSAWTTPKGEAFRARAVSAVGFAGVIAAMLLFMGNVHYFQYRYLYAFGKINALEYITKLGSL